MTRPLPVLALTFVALLGGCSAPPPAGFSGYVEGEYLYLAAPQAGYLKSLDSPRGSRVVVGQALFAVAADPDSQALAEAEARTGAAREKIENLKAPRRPPEIAALEAQVVSAAATLRLADTQLTQQESLFRQRFVAQAKVDEARANRERSLAALDAARQQLATYRIALGRAPEVRGAEADLQAATAQAAQKRWAAGRRRIGPRRCDPSPPPSAPTSTNWPPVSGHAQSAVRAPSAAAMPLAPPPRWSDRHRR